MDAAETEVQEPQQIREEQRRGSIVIRWLGWVGLFVVVYLLSIGPVAKVGPWLDMPGKYPGAGRVVEVIYSPVGFVIDNYPPAERLVTWYLRDIWRIHRDYE